MFWKVLKKKKKRQKSSAIMSGDMNWGEEKNQDLTNQIPIIMPNEPQRVRSWRSENRTQHVATY